LYITGGHYDFSISAIYHNLGLCLFHLEEYQKAEAYLYKAYRLQEKEQDTLKLISSSMDIANLYYEQYKDAQAIPYFTRAYQLSKKTKDFELKQNAALNMAIMEENRKNLIASLAYRKEYESWKDSLTNQNKIWALAELEKKFAVRQKQKEVDVLEAENKIKIAERNGLIISSLALFSLLLMGLYFFRQKIKSNAIILRQKSELDELNQAKDKLFSIVSHDLRSSVYALKNSNSRLLENLESKNFSELDKLLEHNHAIAGSTYNMLDNLLHWALLQTKQSYFRQETVKLFFIVEQVAFNYKAIMFEKGIDFEMEVQKDTTIYADPESLKIILRNLLDNAIKYCGSGDKIAVTASDTVTNTCRISIKDTGKGMSEEKRLELLEATVPLSRNQGDNTGTGLGFQLCRSLTLKNGGNLDIISRENDGTEIILTFLKNNADG
jgi:signal transduction histidine kinase